MKAVRIHEYGGPDVLVYEDVQVPLINSDEILIKVHASGVNPVDWKIREGLRKTVFPSSLPLTLGWDVSGVVAGIGSAVNSFKLDDEVYSRPDITRNGTYAEYIAVRASEVAHKPKSITHDIAAAVPLAGLTAWQALFDMGNLKEGETVVILGASGGVGSLAVQFAKWKKAHVIGVCSSKNVDFLRVIGAHQVIDYKTQRYEEMVKNADLVFDAVGGEAKTHAWKVLKPGGVLVSITGQPNMDDADAKGKRGLAFVVKPSAEQLAQIASLIDGGIVKPVVSTILPLEEARKAQDMLQNQQNIRGKIVLKVVG